MKAMLATIFRAMQRKKLGNPNPKPNPVAQRTDNVVQFDRRQQPRYYTKEKVLLSTEAEVFEIARNACESAWPQPDYGKPELTPNHANNFHGDE